ncbi:MAG: FkbM family methyltransferase [Lentisphaerae bacterium]|nr:FkbM family methyltransferase [Lentisphaerota bacterium]
MGCGLYECVLDIMRRKLRHSVRVKSLLYRILWLLPEHFRSSTRVRIVLKKFADSKRENVFFLNIGANDGIAGDPLREFVVRYRWRGVLVEPVDFVFQRLQAAYAGMPGINCEHAALTDASGSKAFWHLKKNVDLPPGYDQIGSFNKDQVLKQTKLFPGLESFITCTQVPGMTLAGILAKHHVEHVDVMLIDTEGYDFEVVKQIKPAGLMPSLVIYEHYHLSDSDQQECRALLQSMGYAIEVCGGNTIASKGRNSV